MLIGILGIKYSGKDTIADHLVNNYHFNKTTFAKPLKDICKILFCFSDDQLYGNKKDIIDKNWGITPRTVMQYIGTNIFRNDINKIIPNIKDNFWINLMELKFNSINNLVISDVRFQNEIDKIHEMNGIIIKVIRPNLYNIDNHESEYGIDKLNGDFIIYNNGTLDHLYNNIDKIMININEFKKL